MGRSGKVASPVVRFLQASPMASRSSSSKHFFKVMIGDFRTKLSIPPAFYRKLSGEKMDEAVLTSYMGSWDVEVGKSGRLLHFTKGWEEFARNHDLDVGDFVVFQQKLKMRFDVLVFDSSGCEKQLSDKPAGNKRGRTAGQVGSRGHHVKLIKLESDSGVSQKELPRPMAQGNNKLHDHVRQSISKEVAAARAAASASRRPYFKVTITAANCVPHCPYLNIPVEFWRSNDIRTEKSTIGLRDPALNRMWQVKLRIRVNNPQRISLSTGWHAFYVCNKLKIGDVCVFELNPVSPEIPYPVLDVRILPPEQ